MKKLLLLLLLITMPLSYAKILRIGTTSLYPPFESFAGPSQKGENQNYFGYDIDMMGEVCRRINYKCKFSHAQFDNLFDQINAGKIDLAIAAIVITPERQKEFLFSQPYLASSVQFMTTSRSEITQPEQLKQKRVGVRGDTPFKEFAKNLYHNQIKILNFPDTLGLLGGLAHQTVDAVLTDAAVIQYWIANSSSQYKNIGQPLPFGLGYGIMAKLGQGHLMTKINQALTEMKADGTSQKIYQLYFTG